MSIALIESLEAGVSEQRARSLLAAAVEDFAAFRRQREHVEIIDSWMNGEQLEIDAVNENSRRIPGREERGVSLSGRPFRPAEAGAEYDDLESRAPSPFGDLIVTSLAQTAHVTGVRRKEQEPDQVMKGWNTWQRNGFDAKQISLTRAVVGHGLAYVLALPGRDPLTKEPMTVLRARSAKRMAAFYDDEGDDTWPLYAIDAVPAVVRRDGSESDEDGWEVDIIDDQDVYSYIVAGDGSSERDWTYVNVRRHGAGVCPVVRFANRLDLDGRALGDIEPVIPLLRRIDQDTFDRLVVQRFGAWKVRVATGLVTPKTDAEKRIFEAVMRNGDLLSTPNDKARFSTLDETPIDGFVTAGDSDLRHLSAVTQRPPHHLLGLSSNLQAEALAAAEAGLQRRSVDFRTFNGESYEQLFRLIGYLESNPEEAQSYDMQVQWRDTESRSLAQAAAALGVLASGLKIPVEMLWRKVPGWTDADTVEAKKIIDEGGIEAEVEKLRLELEAAAAEAEGANEPDGDAAAAARSNDPKATPADPGGAARGGGTNSKGTPKKAG